MFLKGSTIKMSQLDGGSGIKIGAGSKGTGGSTPAQSGEPAFTPITCDLTSLAEWKKETKKKDAATKVSNE